MQRSILCLTALVAGMTLATAQHAQAQSFAQEVGNVKVGNVTMTAPLSVPALFWGDAYVNLAANGGSATTKPGSIYANQGLNLRFYRQDSLVQQVRDYMEGRTPFLRVTYGMAVYAAEVIGKDPRTKGVMFEQLTWSQGDHMVCRENIKSVADLKGKTVVLQKWGPHIEFLADALDTASLSYGDVKIRYAKDLSGTDASPVAMFRKDNSIDCAFVVTPDIAALVAVDKRYDGAEGTVRGAHVVVSTRELSRSVADVIVVRQDFYDANTDLVTKFAAGNLKGVEKVIAEKKKYGTDKRREYENGVLKPAQQFFGTSLLPTLEDAHGLLSDCTFAGHEGNVVFFTERGNPVGFEALAQSRSKLAKARGFVSQPGELKASSLDWHSNAFVGYLAVIGSGTGNGAAARFDANRVKDELATMTQKGEVDSHTVYAFTITFDANQTAFSAERYEASYEKAVKLARQYGNATIAIRGHVDPTMTLKTLVEAGLSNGTLTRQGAAGNYTYYHNGNRIDLSDTRAVVELINSGQFDRGVQIGPRQVMQQAMQVALARANAVRDSLLAFARSKDVRIDASQITPQGVGVLEPVIARPRNAEEAARNQRVEFRIIRVSAEATKSTDFDF